MNWQVWALGLGGLFALSTIADRLGKIASAIYDLRDEIRRQGGDGSDGGRTSTISSILSDLAERSRWSSDWRLAREEDAMKPSWIDRLKSEFPAATDDGEPTQK